MAEIDEPQYIPLREAVARFPYPMNYVRLWRLVRGGKILAIRPGNEFFVSVAGLKEYIDKTTQPVVGGT